MRANRSHPGLQRQHVTAVQAAADVGSAEVRGAELHSRDFTFFPGSVRGGDYRFDIGTAGSCTLVLQTVLPVLLNAAESTRLTLEGGTHNGMAPPFDFLQTTFLPILNRLGPHVTARLDRPGFYPVGGGKMTVEVIPATTWTPLEMLERGEITDIRAIAVVAKLPVHIAERELRIVQHKLGLQKRQLRIVEETKSLGPGNVVLIELESAQLTEVVSAFGARGKPAEQVAREAAKEADAYRKSNVPVGRHLADQLLVPLALGAGGTFRTLPLTQHTLTNMKIVQRFTEIPVDIMTEQGETGGTVRIGCGQP